MIPPAEAVTMIVKLPTTLVPADTVRVVSMVPPPARKIVLFAIETVGPGGDTALVKVTLPANEFTLVALRKDMPEKPWRMEMEGGLAISWKSGLATIANVTLRACPTGVPDGVLKLPTSTIV
jgi:hypothetical protein